MRRAALARELLKQVHPPQFLDQRGPLKEEQAGGLPLVPSRPFETLTDEIALDLVDDLVEVDTFFGKPEKCLELGPMNTHSDSLIQSGKVFQGDDFTLSSQYEGELDDISEFADISRPVMLVQDFESLRVELFHRLVVLHGKEFQKMGAEEG